MEKCVEGDLPDCLHGQSNQTWHLKCLTGHTTLAPKSTYLSESPARKDNWNQGLPLAELKP